MKKWAQTPFIKHKVPCRIRRHLSLTHCSECILDSRGPSHITRMTRRCGILLRVDKFSCDVSPVGTLGADINCWYSIDQPPEDVLGGGQVAIPVIGRESDFGG
jgi:hypothetical protein